MGEVEAAGEGHRQGEGASEVTDRRRTNPEEVGLPGFLKRTQKSGKAYYYFDNGKKPRKEIPLGPDRDRALAKYNLLIGAVDGYQLKPRTFYLYRHFDDEGTSASP
jgi:hypothetical protein